MDGPDGKIHYRVPPTNKRDWVYEQQAGRGVHGEMRVDHIKGLFIRACLTNTNKPAHHCGEPT